MSTQLGTPGSPTQPGLGATWAGLTPRPRGCGWWVGVKEQMLKPEAGS